MSEPAPLVIKSNYEQIKEASHFAETEHVVSSLIGDLEGGDHTALFRAPPHIRFNRAFVMRCVSTCGHSLAFSGPNLQHDKDVVLAAVRQDGLALRYAAEELLCDREVVLEAVRNNGAALYCADTALKRDVEIACTAASREGESVLPYIDARLRYGPDVQRAAKMGKVGSPPSGADKS